MRDYLELIVANGLSIGYETGRKLHKFDVVVIVCFVSE